MSRVIFYSIAVFYLQYHRNGKSKECSLTSTEYVSLSIEKLTCKIIYNTLLNYQHFPPPTAEKDALNMALTFKKDKKYTYFLFVLQMK